MSTEELKNWFWDKFNNCYIVKHEDFPESYFMYYDEKYIRYKKFARLTGNKIESPNISEGICIFEMDYKYGYFRCKYNEILSFFEINYSDNLFEIRKLINGWLKETDKLSALSTCRLRRNYFEKLMETEKLSALSTDTLIPISLFSLMKTEKLCALSG